MRAGKVGGGWRGGTGMQSETGVKPEENRKERWQAQQTCILVLVPRCYCKYYVDVNRNPLIITLTLMRTLSNQRH